MGWWQMATAVDLILILCYCFICIRFAWMTDSLHFVYSMEVSSRCFMSNMNATDGMCWVACTCTYVYVQVCICMWFLIFLPHKCTPLLPPSLSLSLPLHNRFLVLFCLHNNSYAHVLILLFNKLIDSGNLSLKRALIIKFNWIFHIY